MPDPISVHLCILNGKGGTFTPKKGVISCPCLLTGWRVSRGPQGHRFHTLVRPPQAAVTSAAHPPPRSPDRLRSGERPLHRRARACSRASVWKRWLGPSSGRDESVLRFHLDFGGTAEPPFQSAGNISKLIIRTGELPLLLAAVVTSPDS